MRFSLDENVLSVYTFGIEVEMTGITRRQAADVVAKFFGTEVVHIRNSYDTYTVKDSWGRTWKFVKDGSIRSEKKLNGVVKSATDEYRCEFVTPILRYIDDIETLQNLIRNLRQAKAFVNNSCGLHIHIGAEMFDAQSLKNLVNIFYSKQDLLYKAVEVDPHRTNYCKKLPINLVERFCKVNPMAGDDALADEWYRDFGCGFMGRQGHYNQSRYHGINLHAYWTKGTVEFRLFNSTLHAGLIRAYIILAIAICNQSILQKKSCHRETKTDNDAYSFRVWLLRLGFVGDLTKEPRKHLMNKLQGNSAWRYSVPNTRIIRGDETIPDHTTEEE